MPEAASPGRRPANRRRLLYPGGSLTFTLKERPSLPRRAGIISMKIPISNRKITEELASKLSASCGEELLFVIFGDLETDSRYAERLLACSKDALFTFDADGALITRAMFSELSEVSAKRMYGNCVLSAVTGGEKKVLYRCSYASATFVELAVGFICASIDGGDTEIKLGALEDAFEKGFSVCPKCGRTLPGPGVDCMHCAGGVKVIRKFWKYVRPQLPKMILTLVLSLVSTGLGLVPSYMTKTLIDDVIPSSSMKMLFTVIAILICTYIGISVVNSFRNYFLRTAGNSMIAHLKTDVYRQAQYLPMKFYDKTSTGAVINRINSDCGTLQSFILRSSQDMIVQAFLLVGIAVMMLIMNWKLTLVALTPVPIIVFASYKFGQAQRPFYRSIWRRHTAMSSLLTDTIPCIRVVKSFTGEKDATARFDRYTNEWLKTDTKHAPLIASYGQMINFVINLGVVLIWLVGGRNIINMPETLTVGTLVLFLNYTTTFYGPVNYFTLLNDSIQEAFAASERIMDILDAEPEPDFGNGNIPGPIEGRIKFEHINFSFDRSKKVLSDVSLEIEKGDIVGIVGTTGSGKSTLVNLLMRFYDGYDGHILVDGHDVRDIDLTYWRKSIGFVQQEPMMFHDTIYNNIAYGMPDATPEEVIAAADIANAHDFIARCPDGYDTVLGERGVGLSGGEKQRISIARAVLKNPAILVFDEATAAVDSETEHLIQEAIDRLIYGRTTLMIAHRLSTLAKANKIVVVDQGHIIECGTPEELLALKGKYYRLVQIQSAGANELSKDSGDIDLLN